jgi:hypothetical protein
MIKAKVISRNTSQIASTGKITTKTVKRWNLLGYTCLNNDRMVNS